MYDKDFRHSATKTSYHLLESSRVFTTNSYEFNFHIFYKLVLGAPKSMLDKIYLNESSPYNVSKRHEISKGIFVSFQKCQYRVNIFFCEYSNFLM